MVVILASVKMESIVKIIQTCHAKFMKLVCRHGGDTEDMRQNFPFAWFFFPLFTDTSNLLPQCWSTNEETVKGLEPPVCFLPQHQKSFSLSDKFPRKLAEFLTLGQSLFLFLQVIIPLPFLSLHCTKLLLFYGFLFQL